MAAAAAGTRKQIAFYASPRPTARCSNCIGWGELQTDLHRLSLDGRWDAMVDLIDDRDPRDLRRGRPVDRLAPR